MIQELLKEYLKEKYMAHISPRLQPWPVHKPQNVITFQPGSLKKKPWKSTANVADQKVYSITVTWAISTIISPWVI